MPCRPAFGRLPFAAVALALFLGNAAAQPTSRSDSAGDASVDSSFRVVRRKTPTEIRFQQVIEDAFRRCFRSYRIDGVSYELRIPFGENGERENGRGFTQNFHEWGKADPEVLWKRIDALLFSSDFLSYRTAIGAPGAKAIVFDLETALWRVQTDAPLIASLREGRYPGTRTRVYVLKTDSALTTADIYNYLYCVGSVGMDCSGFVSFIQRAIARAAFPDAVSLDLGYSSLWYFTPAGGRSEIVEGRVSDLRPGDIFIFFGHLGTFRHSAVIQSIDWSSGLIRYLQDTDWAPLEDRGVHESFIRFDPSYPHARLGDPAVRWLQRIQPAFPGEAELQYWKTDGDRYRALWPRGKSLVVRLHTIKAMMTALESGFYDNRIRIEYRTRP